MELNLNIKEKIEEIAKKIQGDPGILKDFQADPIKTVEKLIGVDLPDDKLEPIVAGVKTRLAASKLGEQLDGLKNLF